MGNGAALLPDKNHKKTRFTPEMEGRVSIAAPLPYPYSWELRPVALRPNLSEGLPFGKLICLSFKVMYRHVDEKLELFLLGEIKRIME